MDARDRQATEDRSPMLESIVATLWTAARTTLVGESIAARVHVAELASRHLPHEERAVATASGMALAEGAESAWQRGWQPLDVRELARRRCPAKATRLVVDAIAADAAQYPSVGLHPRWQEQLRQLGATVWWEREEPHLCQWAREQGISVEHALHSVIHALGTFAYLPSLPVTVPPPGSDAACGAQPAEHIDPRLLHRVRSLLAKAESTQFPEEAEALSAKAQAMMNRHALARALLDADRHAPQAAGSSRLWLDSPYVDAKAQLVAAIAEANRCKSVSYSGLGLMVLVGHELDLEITELLATSLLVQATQAMLAHGSQRGGSGRSSTRSFRRSFLLSYARRIGERLTEAARTAHDPHEDARLLPVLAERDRAVEETFRQYFGTLRRRRVSASNGEGWDAGRAAADRANLSVERQVVEA
ncbi:DUF2786 domain-containing protein [Haloechinothrix sp. LS1_15]|uniref:DUF2786 domain-containing protein n=1 Tax=Haloechinothrix sp. LS1_15 TaxID=2652248 RepID=UPI00294822C0|nr:DUF2786 domain-containing protein [Haloechinothrix sp. LS1_15]MDV6012568.1 DUF2786 domain-containing protein [Haloechinothrix sp. LS1_15]